MTMKEVKLNDLHILCGSVYVDDISRSDVEFLYTNLPEEMRLLGWSVDVWDYDYMDRLDISLDSDTSSNITNSKMMRDKFKYDLVHCINNILSER